METNRTVYDPSTGTRLEPKGEFNVKYGSGFAKGTVYRDKVTMGNLTVEQSIGCATSVDAGDINDRKLDGLIGIGFNSGSKHVHNGVDQSKSATKSPTNTGKSQITNMSMNKKKTNPF